MPVDVSPSILAPLIQLGLAGIVIIALAWAYLRERTKVDDLYEARRKDQVQHAEDKQKFVDIVEKLIATIREREDASDARWKVIESSVDVVRNTGRGIERLADEVAVIHRQFDLNSQRLDDMHRILTHRTD